MIEHDGEVVQSGSVLCDWQVRRWVRNDEGNGLIEYQYDWIMDDGLGGYTESDLLYKSVDEAMISLGVR